MGYLNPTRNKKCLVVSVNMRGFVTVWPMGIMVVCWFVLHHGGEARLTLKYKGFLRMVRLVFDVMQWLVVVLGICFMGQPTMAMGYSPRYDVEEQQNIAVYERAAQSVVTVSTVLNGKPSSGAGVIIQSDGLILTSRHVVGAVPHVSIALADGHTYTGKVVATMSEPDDLALIQIESAATLTFLPLADSDRLKVGQKVLAIGNPYGFERTLTLGIISRIDQVGHRLQTDAAINPGSSGGPLLDSQGYVVGINQSIFNPDGDRSNIGIGFAVPVNVAKSFVHQVQLALVNQQQYSTTGSRQVAVVDQLPRTQHQSIPGGHWVKKGMPIAGQKVVPVGY